MVSGEPRSRVYPSCCHGMRLTIPPFLDLQEPFCGTCSKVGYTCSGYSLPVVIVPHQQPARRRQQQQRQVSGEADVNVPFRGTASTPQLVAREMVASIPIPPLDPDTDFCQFFLCRLVIGNGLYGAGMARLLCGFLTTPVATGSVQHKCIRALVAGYYSLTAVNGQAQQLHSTGAYSAALASVSHMVANNRQLEYTDALLSIMCLGLYENIVVTNPRAWLDHYAVISALVSANTLWRVIAYADLPSQIESRGPDHYRSGHNREVFLAFRYLIVGKPEHA